MSGIFIHIPYCKQKCYYCDFYSVANTKSFRQFLNALTLELELQKNYLGDSEIKTIYFGGGTPSLCQPKDIYDILNTIHRNFRVSSSPEITIEANPDDLNREYLQSLFSIKINRLSIGIQSFNNKDLAFLNRRHDAVQAINSVKTALDCGFRNISIDLIYGLPGMTLKEWGLNLDEAFSLGIQHLSAYHLTIEEKTVLHHQLTKGKFEIVKEEESLKQFKLLIVKSESNGFLHYEISNFCLPGFISEHNSNYWKQEKYLGVGPSAHSFDIYSRQWNLRSVEKYIESIEKNIIPCEKEEIDEITRYNEYVMTSLRTMWGADKEYLKTNFGNLFLNHFLKISQKYIESGHITKDEKSLKLSSEGMFISDSIIADLIFIG